MALNLELDRGILLFDTRYSLVKSVPIKETVKDDFIFQPTRLKAVDQKPAAGTLIATGSKVIVYFENVDEMGIDMFEGAHAGYTGKTAKDVVDQAIADVSVKKIIESKENSADLSPEEKVIMVNFFAEKLGLQIDESDSTRNTKAAYDVLAASYGLMK
jgi:hypothetical protein